MFDGRWRQRVEEGVAPVGSRLGARRLKPDHLTALGLVMAVAAAIVIATGHLLIGLVLFVLSAVPDLLDGAVAKATGMSSVRGAFFDSVSDRVTDSLILGGVAWYLASTGSRHAALLPFAVLGMSTLISYERAKAESLGFEAKGGLMERAERIIALCIGLAFSVVLVPVLWLMLALTSMTAVQRFFKVWRQAPGPASSAPSSGTPTPPVAEHPPVSRWREWREASVQRAHRPAEMTRWRAALRREPEERAARRRDTTTRAWRRRDRTRP